MWTGLMPSTLQWCRCGRFRGRNLAGSVAVRRRYRAGVGVFCQIDFQTGFCCADGQVVIEGQGTLLHSLVFPPLIEQWLINNRDTTYPGDVIITNDPYVGDEMGYPGASHLPDIYMLCPVFMDDDQLVAWSVAGGHQRDVGGAQPGSCATDSTEIYQEGLRIPFMKLYEKGVRNADLLSNDQGELPSA